MHLSQYWTYVVGNRLRFTDATRATLQRKALEDVNRMGVSTPSLDSLISGGLIEVSMPYEREDLGWEYRTCPWESFLSLATKVRRKPGEHLTVIRHLRRRAKVTARAAPASLLVVVSAPGKLRELFDFSRECELVQSAFASRFRRGRMFRLNNPSAEDIRAVVIECKPDIIHLAGVDAHQKAMLLGEADDPMRFDGFVLRGEGGTAHELNSEEMGRTLTADGRHAPRLVSFNCYNSAARLAGLTVAHGAVSAVGFQDTIDDAVAEQFFANLYSAWEQLGWERLAEAFALSREQVALTTESRNSGDVVLWNSASVFTVGKKSLLPQWVRDITEALRAGVPWLEALRRAQMAPPRRTVRMAVSARPVRGAAGLEVNVTPLSSLNYSLLHNRRGLFEKFQITAPAGIHLPLDIEVSVELCVGDNAYPVRGQFTITGPVTNLHERIHLPLVAALLRGRREGIVTTLAVEVVCAGRTLHRETYPLRLRPPDEWTDEENDQADQCWLPSFILPRDPAVQHIVEAAQRYLQTLADDSGAGFDGYQRLTREGDDPQGAVESQVRALWSALLYEKEVDYINPPPTYTAGAQRVRTPSQIFEEGRGTCIDVALLFCACLEYVGLMPVMFLVPGHAFPGYWRSPQAREQFWNFVFWRTGDDETFTPERQLPTWLQQRVDAEQMDRATALRFMQEARPSDTVREPWMVVGEGGQAEVTRALQSNGLVPLESTLLTSSGSFRQAQDLGVRNLVTPWGFEAMVEIQRARDEGVTPLPLLNQEI